MASESNGRPAFKEPIAASQPSPSSPPPSSPPPPPQQGTLDAIERMLRTVLARQAAVEKRVDMREEERARRPAARERRARTVIMGRDGELLSRRHEDSTDQFELPHEFTEMAEAEGWCYEWKTENVTGKDQLTYQARLQANGWRPVPNSRIPGIYAHEGDEGPVRYDGMILMERPLALTIEAREDDHRRATDQVRMKHDSWGVNSKNRDVFDPNTPMARSFTVAPRTTGAEVSDPNWIQPLVIAGNEE